jgi:PAS domain S-box-containing protein
MEQALNIQKEINNYEDILSINAPVAALAITVSILAWLGLFSWTTFLMLSVLGFSFSFEIARTWKKYLLSKKELKEETKKRKTAEAALKESEEKFRTVIENSNDGIAFIRDGIILYTNPKYVEIFGYDCPDDFQYWTASVNVHPDDLERVKDIYFRREKGEPVPSVFEYKGVRRNGEIVHIEFSCARASYQGEAVTIAFLQDVTKRKEAERVLLEARIQAGEANRAKCKILTHMTHRVRAPMNRNIGLTDAISEQL